MATRTRQASNKLYYIAKQDVFSEEIRSRLPEAYKKFYKEWRMTTPSPVHYVPKPGKWERNPKTGVVTPIQNIPIPLKFPTESNNHLWGGEGVIQGFVKRGQFYRRNPRFWVPTLKNTVVYSEILDKHMSVIVTGRTIDLIIKNNGFDHYILKTPPCDLQSILAVKLKRKLLISLFDKDLYTNDPLKQEEVYNKYKHYMDSYNREDLEWYGLSITEAIHKMIRIEDETKPVPLKHQYRQELLAKLYEKEMEVVEAETKPPQLEERSSWLKKLNPFNRS